MCSHSRWMVLAALTGCAAGAPADDGVSAPDLRAAVAPSPDGTLVRTRDGYVRGAAEDAMLAWRGIPFAAPPVGDLRWRLPQPVTPWSGEIATTQFKPVCFQPE